MQHPVQSGRSGRRQKLPVTDRRARPDGAAGKRRKILFLVTEDWYFLSHRLCLGQACRARGWDVVVATQVGDGRGAIEAAGLRIAPMTISRGGRNPFRDLRTLLQIIAIYRRERPDIVHHVALKPVIYGSIAAIVAGRPAVINTLAGMGYVFTARGLAAGLLRGLVRFLLRVCLRGRRKWLIVQNRDDAAGFVENGFVAPGRLALIHGSGVDPARFRPAPEPPGTIVVAVVSRMLADKGIHEAVAACRALRARGADLILRLVGDPDPGNPSSIAPATLRQWHRDGAVDWLGHRTDIAEIWAGAHIALLPSYREGLPKSLIEAAACGRPMIAADVPGCREVVRPGETGLLVPARDADALAAAIETLAASPELRRRMGKAARDAAERLFSEERIVGETLALYDRALAAAEQPG